MQPPEPGRSSGHMGVWRIASEWLEERALILWEWRSHGGIDREREMLSPAGSIHMGIPWEGRV